MWGCNVHSAGQDKVRLGEHLEISGKSASASAEMFRDMARDAYATQGADAFSCPKSAAAAHEAGHAIIHALQGFVPTSVKIWPANANGRTYWKGLTDGAPPWRLNTNTAKLTELFEQASLQIAGWCAETLFDAEHFKRASSLDEVVMAKMIGAAIEARTGRDQRDVFLETIVRTGWRLREYEPVARAIIGELTRRCRIDAQRLRTHLLPILRAEKVPTPWGQPPDEKAPAHRG
jgi:hypothetical protein